MTSRADFLGEIDESRLIGGFRDDLTDGDKLALQNFIAREFGLNQIEAPRDTSGVAAVIERHGRLSTQIDLLCLDISVLRACEPALVSQLVKLLSSKAILCVDASDKSEPINASLFPAGAFDEVMAAPGFAVFAHSGGGRSPRSICYQIDLFRRRRYVERKCRARLSAEPKIPEVAVFVLTYKHEAFIADCLRSIIIQQGHFTLRVLIIDDLSPDNTAQVARSIIEKNHSDRIKIELRVNPCNVGASNNWAPALKWAEGADYVTFIDGDDFWSSKYRIQKHIDFMREHNDVFMSFNTFEFCSDEAFARWKGFRVDETIVSADRLVKDNPVGHLGATFYSGELVEIFPIEPFYYINGDWMINVYCAQISEMGYVDETLSVYRLHSGSVWSLRRGIDRILPTIDVILRYNEFTDFNFNHGFNWLLREQFKALSACRDDPADDKGKIDLIAVYDGDLHRDDFFCAEFISYLRAFPSALILAELDVGFQRWHTGLGSCLIEDDGGFPLQIAKMVYVATLGKTIATLGRIEAACVPFVFSLNLEPGFSVNDSNVAAQLKRVFRSPLLQKVIVTQKVIFDDLQRKGLCPLEKMEFIHGGVMPQATDGTAPGKRRWGYGKSRLDIAFMTRKRAPFDKNSGYERFVEAAKALRISHDDICFHVVGAVSPCAVSVASLSDRIKFYGELPPDRCEAFFREMDIILSPNFSGKPHLGAGDSFPTVRCVEAGARGIAIFATDEFNVASDDFSDGKDIVLVKPNVEDIVAQVERYYNDPSALKMLGERGAQSIRALYCPETQIAPRIALLREAIADYKPFTETLALKMKIAVMQVEIERRDEQIAKLRKRPRLLIRGLRRFLGGRSDTTLRQMIYGYQSAGLRGVGRILLEIGDRT